MNKLATINEARRQDIESFCKKLLGAHSLKSLPDVGEYPLADLRNQIGKALLERWGKGCLDFQFELIEREKFGGDIVLKFPHLLKDGGPKQFIKNHQPWIMEVLSGEEFSESIVNIEKKGMYINLTLSDRWLLNSAQVVINFGSNFGVSNTQADRRIIVDYSSPNVAKILHAGHIRSTIIGHVLSNLHEACGALVYRINHINDFGGFGFNLEGYRIFKNQFPPKMSNNEQLLEIYRIRRTMEQLVKTKLPLDKLSEEERALLTRYFPNVRTEQELKETFEDFKVASNRRFSALEAGLPEEVDLWMQMVQWSMNDFNLFYDALNIHIDLVIGESFYLQAGNALIDSCLESGKALVYSKTLAEQNIRDLDAQLEQGEITQPERNSRAEFIQKDIGAVVVLLDNGEQYVVRSKDGHSIYSTRDLGAIALRCELFAPTDITYVVGQEQQVHFSRLFKTADAIGIAPGVQFKHLYFGFYIDAQTGKKLSSRDTVSSVNHLLTESIAHFRSRLNIREDLTEVELDNAAFQLSVGSLVFNDLKQDMKGSVEIDSTTLENTISGFEKSGGAYMIYSACRADSILRRYGAEITPAHKIKQFKIDPQEAILLLKIQQLPEKVVESADQSNPSVLVRHLLEIASIYNSYYARAPVIVDGVANLSRLLITKAVKQSLTNGLRFCHIDCPPKI